jgi:hypothetical protein
MYIDVTKYPGATSNFTNLKEWVMRNLDINSVEVNIFSPKLLGSYYFVLRVLNAGFY